MSVTGSFEGRLFAEGLAPVGEAVRVGVAMCRLHVDGPVLLTVPLSAVSASIGGFEHETVFLNFRDGELRYSLQLVGEGALACVREQAPPALLAELGRLAGGVSWRRWMWRGVLGAAAVLGMALGFLVLRYDQVVVWSAGQVSPENERRLGQQVVVGLRGEGRLLEAGPAVQAIADIGNRLTAGSRYDYRWFVLLDEDVNAFAAPGGVVVVHSGLIAAAESAEEVAGVLAHEVQHVELRHSLQNMINAIGWAAALSVVLGDVGTIAGVLVHQAGAMRFSRELEAEADAKGLEALRRAGLAAQGMVRFFRRLQEEEKGAVPLLSSHPAAADRIERLERAIAAQPWPHAEPLRLDWSALQRGLEEEASIGPAQPARGGNESLGARSLPWNPTDGRTAAGALERLLDAAVKAP